MTRTNRDLVRIGLTLALLLSCPASGKAELNMNPAVIRQQLEQSVRLQKMALDRLGNPREFVRLTWDAYVQLRAAHEGLNGNVQHSKFPNPLYPFASTKLQKARDSLLWGREALKSPQGVVGGTPEAVAAQRIQESVHLIQMVLATAF